MRETMQSHSYNIGDNMVDSDKEKCTPHSTHTPTPGRTRAHAIFLLN